MSLKQNIIYLYFKGKHLITSKSQYQYNHGQYLYFADLNLPQAFEVHFSNKDRGESKTQIGSDKLVEIPDEYFWSGALEIYAWIYLHTGKDDGETIYEVKIPLIKRAKPTDEEPLPVQQSAIDKAIAELNNAVDITNENADKTNADKTQVATIKEEVVVLKEEIDSTASAVNQDAQSARESADASEQSAQNSAESERKALDYSDEAKGYAQSALESKNTATQKAQVASDASAEAKDFRDEAETFKNEAEQAKQNIVDYRDETKGYRDETLTAKDDAQTIKGDVQSLKTQIDETADNVFENARKAYRSMISADNASLSASESAENASQSANEANQSAINASESANQAEEFKNQSATNVAHYPKVVDGYWYVWDANNNEYINTNVDARGIKGDKGDVGDTGNGIESTVLNSDYTLTITFTDGTSYTTPSIRGEKGLKGDIGNGIASTVLNNDYTLTINFTDGTQYTTTSIRGKQGEKGDQGEVGESGVYIGTDEPTDEDIKVWIDSDGTADSIVTDVQINGTSIVDNSVANIPYGSNDNYGLMKASSTNGIFASGGVLSINNASESDIKGGEEELKPITPNREHMATFYGLSKAAGVDEKNSNLSIGEYSDNAKTAIRDMIGAASDEEVNHLKEELNAVKNEVMPVTVVPADEMLEWQQGNIKPNDGGTSSSVARIRTQGYIPNNVSKLIVTDSDYKLLVYGYTASESYVGMWDGTSIRAYSSSRQYMYDEFDMDDAGDYKVRVVLRREDGGDVTPSDASKVNCSTIESIADTVDALYADMSTLTDAVYKDVLASDVTPTWKQGNFNASTGSGTTGTTTLITDGYLPETVKGISINNDEYLFSVFAYNDDGSYVGLYDEASDTYKTTGWTKSWITAFDVLKQNPNGYKLRLRVKNSEQTTITADKADKLTYKVIRAEYMGSSNPCEYDWKYEACVFDKMLCIGDSLIAGGVNYPDITPDDANATRTITAGMYSNPTCLSKYFGFVTTNWGISGATTRSWYNSKSAENWGGYDSALIYIGSNDYNYVTTDGMTIEEGANLSETMIRNIIAKLKADNAGIRIFLCTLLPATTTGSYAQYRIPLMEKIRTIAGDTSGVFLIDLNTYSSFKSNSAYSNGHPTAIGYQWMSREIGAYMCWWISHYPNEFKWIRWIGTKYAVTGTAPDSRDDDGGYGGDVQ